MSKFKAGDVVIRTKLTDGGWARAVGSTKIHSPFIVGLVGHDGHKIRIDGLSGVWQSANFELFQLENE